MTIVLALLAAVTGVDVLPFSTAPDVHAFGATAGAGVATVLAGLGYFVTGVTVDGGYIYDIDGTPLTVYYMD